MANTKNNARSRRTEVRMEAAALELMRDTSPERLTVRAICERAGVNRSTFYAHFLDVPEMVERMESHLHRELVGRYVDGDVDPLTAESFVPFLEHVRDHVYFYRTALPLRTSFPLEQGRDSIMEKIVRPRCSAAGIDDESQVMYYFVFFQAGFTMVLRRWVDGGCEDRVDDVARTIEGCVPPALR